MPLSDPHVYLESFWKDVLPEIKQLAWRNVRAAVDILPDHTHEGAVEIVFVPTGEMIYFIGERMYNVRGGQFFVTAPDEVHSTGNLPMGVGELYWTEISTERRENYLGLSPLFAEDMRKTLLSLPSGLHMGNKAMFEHLEVIFKLLPSKNRAKLLRAHAHFLALLNEVAACVEQRPEVPERDWTPAFEMIESNLSLAPSLAELAESMALSESRFKVLFKEFCGISPAEYITRRRVERSKEMLRSEEASITDVAVELGFSSSQYFSTVFRKFAGQTPREFQRLNRDG